MKKYLLVFGIIFYSLQLLAENIDGPANVRTGPKGFTVISLFDKVEVDCTEPIGDWFQIGIYVKITENQYKSKIPIQKGDTLINWKNEKVGIALANIPDSIFSTWYSGGAPGNPRRYGNILFYL